MLRVDLLLPVPHRHALAPFLAVGPGAFDSGGNFALSLSVGGGIKYPLSDSLQLRGDLREVLVSGEAPTAKKLELTAGISWVFGRTEWQLIERPVIMVAAAEPAAPKEDHDKAVEAGKAAAVNPWKIPTPPKASEGEKDKKNRPPTSNEAEEKGAGREKEKGAVAADGGALGAMQTKYGPFYSGGNWKERQKGPYDEPLGESYEPEAMTHHDEAPPGSSGEKAAGRPEASASPGPIPSTGGASVKPGNRPVEEGAILQEGRRLPEGCAQTGSADVQESAAPWMTIVFPFNKDVIPQKYKRQLVAAAGYLKDAPRTRAIIAVHTDITRESGEGMALARRCVECVKNYLVSLGVDPSQCVVRVLGPCAPATGNDPSRKRNRAATVSIILSGHKR